MTDAGAPRCIHDMVAEQVARTPDRIAVSIRGRTLTFRRLDEAAEALASRLRAAGVGGGSVVAVVLGRTPELIVTLYAILKAGGAYLYLDPAEPSRQRERIVCDARARFAVVGSRFGEQVPDVKHILFVGPEMTEASAPEPAEPARPLHPDTPPTSATPRAPPASPRAWSSPTARSGG